MKTTKEYDMQGKSQKQYEDSSKFGFISMVLGFMFIVLMLLCSCEKEELACYQFMIQKSVEIYCDGELVEDNRKPFCPTTEEKCGYTYEDAVNFAKYNSYENKPLNYTVLYGGCAGCDGESIVYETKIVTIIN